MYGYEAKVVNSCFSADVLTGGYVKIYKTTPLWSRSPLAKTSFWDAAAGDTAQGHPAVCSTSCIKEVKRDLWQDAMAFSADCTTKRSPLGLFCSTTFNGSYCSNTTLNHSGYKSTQPKCKSPSLLFLDSPNFPIRTSRFHLGIRVWAKAPHIMNSKWLLKRGRYISTL